MSELSITGNVVGQNNEALPGVVVSVDGEGIEPSITTVTNDEGRFLLRDLPPPGQFLLSAAMDGFMDWKKPVVVTPGQSFIANITMYEE